MNIESLQIYDTLFIVRKKPAVYTNYRAKIKFMPLNTGVFCILGLLTFTVIPYSVTRNIKHYDLKPNTHRRRWRDETVLSRRVGVGGVYMNS